MKDVFHLLPYDLLQHVLERCDARSVLCFSSVDCNRARLAGDAMLWCALLRLRHHELFGDSDPLLSLLPSAALGRDAPSSPAFRPRWPQLFQECEREWLCSHTEPCADATWTIWLAWRRRFCQQPSSAQTDLVLSLLGLRGPRLSRMAEAPPHSLLTDLAVPSVVAAVALYAWLAAVSP